MSPGTVFDWLARFFLATCAI